jgi:hypothetical protein
MKPCNDYFITDNEYDVVIWYAKWLYSVSIPEWTISNSVCYAIHVSSTSIQWHYQVCLVSNVLETVCLHHHGFLWWTTWSHVFTPREYALGAWCLVPVEIFWGTDRVRWSLFPQQSALGQYTRLQEPYSLGINKTCGCVTHHINFLYRSETPSETLDINYISTWLITWEKFIV